MRKIISGLIILLLMSFLVCCGNSSASKNDARASIASGDNFEAKKRLLLSSELHADELIALCNNPYPMSLASDQVREWFKEAIERTELTAEQQVQIIKIDKWAYTEAVLLSNKLTAEVLVAICENQSCLNLGSTQVREWFKEAIERTELTAEQQVQIIEMDEYAYTKALLLSNKLTAEALVAICNNPYPMNLEDDQVKEWFKEAIKRTDLTVEQEIQIATKLGFNEW